MIYWRDAADGFHRKQSEAVGQRADEFSVDIHGAAAHPGDNARFVYVGPRNPYHDDVVFRVEDVFHDAQHFDVEGVDPGVLKNREAVSAHARLHVFDIHESAGSLPPGRRGGGKQTGEENRKAGCSFEIHGGWLLVNRGCGTPCETSAI